MNYAIALPTLLIPVIYKFMQFFASGNFYRMKISKSDTNLNIVEKLIQTIMSNESILKDEFTNLNSYCLCNTIIEESLFHLKTGYRIRANHIGLYNNILRLCGLPYIACFATRVHRPNKALKDLSARSFFVFLVISAISITAIFVCAASIGHILSQTYILLGIKNKIKLFFLTVFSVLMFLVYIISTNNLGNSFILYRLLKKHKGQSKFHL